MISSEAAASGRIPFCTVRPATVVASSRPRDPRRARAPRELGPERVVFLLRTWPIGEAPVSKTGRGGFDSCGPCCMHHPSRGRLAEGRRATNQETAGSNPAPEATHFFSIHRPPIQEEPCSSASPSPAASGPAISIASARTPPGTTARSRASDRPTAPSAGRAALPCRVPPDITPNPEALWHTSTSPKTTPAFETMHKRRRGFPSETRVKRGDRVVRGTKRADREARPQ